MSESKVTRILSLPPAEPLDRKIIAAAADCLRRGKLVIIPTDTVYGLAADFHNREAVNRLRRAKGRPAAKPIPILAANRAQIKNIHARLGKAGAKLAGRYWPGPLTLVLPVTHPATSHARRTAKIAWEGFRIPAHPVALAVIKAAGGLLRVTSANLSGQAPALTAEAAGRKLRGKIALTLDGGPSPGGVPSTVVKIVDDQAIILRKGAIAAKDIFAALKDAPR